MEQAQIDAIGVTIAANAQSSTPSPKSDPMSGGAERPSLDERGEMARRVHAAAAAFNEAVRAADAAGLTVSYQASQPMTIFSAGRGGGPIVRVRVAGEYP